MNKIPAVSIMGWSGSGKTTLIERMVPLLKGRGLKVGVLKHDSHQFEMDREGKDTWRYGQAGAEVVAISSPRQAAMLEFRALDLDQMLDRFREVDLILVEGYKTSSLPRIEVHRTATGKPPAEQPDKLAALVTDATMVIDIPHFDLNDAKGVTEFVIGLLGLDA